MQQLRKQKREDLIMKRRGLNFITDQHEQNLDEESINLLETEVDNIAPKTVGILSLNGSCDTKNLRTQLVDYCIDYMDQLKAQTTKRKGRGGDAGMDDEQSGIDRDSPF